MMSDINAAASGSSPESSSGHVQSSSPSEDKITFFLIGGLICIGVALLLFCAAPFFAFPEQSGVTNDLLKDKPDGGELSRRDLINFYYLVFKISLKPLFCLVAAIICLIVGIKLLRAVGFVTPEVIPPQDRILLQNAITEQKGEAISLYVHLSSLSGITGAFTKLGLSGLPLATIGMTLILAIFGLFNPQFVDLTKLTLGAFLGSFAQRKMDGTNYYSREK